MIRSVSGKQHSLVYAVCRKKSFPSKESDTKDLTEYIFHML